MMKKSAGGRLKPLSLHPLHPDDALAAILATPPPKKTRRTIRQKKKRTRPKE
jgi:hypothetical protein